MNKKLTTQKRIRTAVRNYYRNRAYKSSVKTTVKNCILSTKKMNYDNINDISLNISEAFSRIDKCVKCRIIHKNKGARKKSALSKLFKKQHAKVCSNLS